MYDIDVGDQYHKENGVLSLLVGHVDAVELLLPVVLRPQPLLKDFPETRFEFFLLFLLTSFLRLGSLPC